MKIEIKEHDYFKREHTVSYNFTVRTNGYNSWKINVVIQCNNEKLDFDYLSNNLVIDSYMAISGNEAKGLFLRKNMPIEIQMEVFSWLSDFPRYHIVETFIYLQLPKSGERSRQMHCKRYIRKTHIQD